MAEYIVHKAVELSKVKAKRKAELSVQNYLEENFIAQPKYDGCNMVALFDGATVDFFSRTGEPVLSVPHIEMAMATFPNMTPGAYFGECWAPDLPFNEISGLFRRQTADEDTCRLQFAIFDFITPEEWDDGVSTVAYGNRVARMTPQLSAIPQALNPIWLAGSFGHIAETWANTTAQDVCNKLVEAGGYDGLILRDPYGHWRKGDRGTGGEIIKIKRKLSFDLRVVGFEPGKGKHAGKIGSLIVEFRGQRMGAGTGLRDDERDVAQFENNWLGKIVEIEAMDYSADGLLREPRLKGIRLDKLEPDA
ncbi:DNA ligase, phage-associated [Xylella phage Cota]|uniref:DNA ligase n=1 Tax=Xylella phage Cota TaxID=2699877 RepID=A0A6F8ZLG2_9CAUD|nr:DNA ligase, phage-associated [Xylella phage Cota]